MTWSRPAIASILVNERGELFRRATLRPMTGTSGAIVAFEHVTKRYGGPDTPPAVTDLSLTIPAGEVCVLVGPSGCGKTTAMKMVNRLIEPTGGRITDRRRGRHVPARPSSCGGASAT